ncbi:energy transducer TonB [Qipengyuania sp. DSG2-2]|uniref:energy transducer TonB n=1 Tax=Qipengyuania sp. DGS2-2 TaxID=3349631 RepID=UPI0036D20A17
MAYTDSPSAAKRTGAVSGVVIIHAAIGVALVTGLATNFVPSAPEPPLVGGQIDLPPPPPKPDEQVEPDTPQPPSNREVYVPPRPIPIPAPGPALDSTRELPPPSPPGDRFIPNPGPTFTPTPPAPPPPAPTPSPGFTPKQAVPSNAQANWITTADYRPSWIRRGLEGTASFRLTVGANGRVSDCTITRSTGHEALDTATCKLATRRARFDAARDSNGDRVSGTFTSSVLWQIPE